MSMDQILFLEPIVFEKIWGGDRIGTFYGCDLPSDKVGEAWVVSAHENGDSMVKNGKFKGKHLSTLWENHRELFGNMQESDFPLLVKIIDAKNDLSIQVHPDDDYAFKHENGSLGKTECWYIVDCEEDANIIIGHNAKDKNMLKDMIHNSKWKELIKEIPIKKGDFFQIEPGTVHAIKAGTLILEIQQNSDVTYRLYDYDRISEGKPRDLHIDKSIDVITCPQNYSRNKVNITRLDDGIIEDFITTRYYKVRKIQLQGQIYVEQSEPFTITNVIKGTGEINGVPIHKGDSFIIPNGYKDYTLSGDMTLIQSSPVI